jgi:hypothetical protein
MNYLRLIFTFLFALIIVTLFIYSTLQFWQGTHPSMSSLGLLLASAAPLLFLIVKQFLANYTQSLQAIGFSTICGLGLAITLTSSWKYGDTAGIAHWGAGLCLILWFVYLRWIARNASQAN